MLHQIMARGTNPISYHHLKQFEIKSMLKKIIKNLN